MMPQLQQPSGMISACSLESCEGKHPGSACLKGHECTDANTCIEDYPGHKTNQHPTWDAAAPLLAWQGCCHGLRG
eukprot:593778-Pelagomonas_calceolata.AAC.3